MDWSERAVAQAARILPIDTISHCNHHATIQAALNNVPAVGTFTVVVNAAGGSHYENLTIPNNVTIYPGDANCAPDSSRTIYLEPPSSAMPAIDIAANRNVAIYNLNTSGGNHAGIGGGIRAGLGVELDLHSSVVHHSTAAYGGGIGFEGGGTLRLFDSTVQKTHATELGGGIFMGDGSTLEMDGGSSVGRTNGPHWWGDWNVSAGKGGGGIHLGVGTTAHLYGGAEVKQATAGTTQPWPSPSVGHGGCIGGAGVVSLSGGAKLTECRAPGNGGAVYGTSVTVDGAFIDRGEAGHNGGAIFAGTVDVLGGSLLGGTSVTHGNTAENDGGAIYATGSVRIEGTSTVRDSHAGRDGGAVWSPSVLIKNTAKVQDASAEGHGGCIWGDSTTLENSAVVTGCDAGGTGGAIRGEDVLVNGSATVSHGQAATSGGLVHVAPNGQLSVAGTSTLSDGATPGWGGLVSVTNGAGLLASGNAKLLRGDAGISGGLVYFAPGSTGTIEGNVELRDGESATRGGLIRHAGLGTLFIKDNVKLENGVAGTHGGLISLGAGSNTEIGSVDPSQVVLANGAASGDGGGIRVIGTPQQPSSLTVYGSASIVSSSATNGGGISAEDATVNLQQEVQIGAFAAGNTASLNGGGIQVHGGELSISGSGMSYPNQGFGPPSGGVRIEHNQAGPLGGGVALLGGASMNAKQLVVHKNVAAGAGGSGGGIAAVGGSAANFYVGVISENSARRGGGVYVTGQSSLVVLGEDPIEGGGCQSKYLPPDRYCAELTGNKAEFAGSVANEGGGLYSGWASVLLDKVGIQKNTAATDGTALLFASRASADLTNVLVAGTNDAVHRSVVVKQNAAMDATMSTFADIGTTVRYDSGAAGHLHGNVIWPHTGIGNGLSNGGATVTGDCNLGMGMGGISGSGNTGANPNFIVTARGKYRINASSPAHDHCDSGPDHDLDRFDRFTYLDWDAGAFEVPIF